MAQFKVMTWNVENLFDVGAEDGPDTEAELSVCSTTVLLLAEVRQDLARMTRWSAITRTRGEDNLTGPYTTSGGRYSVAH